LTPSDFENAVKRYRRLSNGILISTAQSHLNLKVDKVASKSYFNITRPMVDLLVAVFNIYGKNKIQDLIMKFKLEVKESSKLFGKKLLKEKKDISIDPAKDLRPSIADESQSNYNTLISSQALQSNSLINDTDKIIPRAGAQLFLQNLSENDDSILKSFKSNPNYAVLINHNEESEKLLFFIMKLQPATIQQKLSKAIKENDQISLSNILRNESFFAIFKKHQSISSKTKKKLISHQLALDELIGFLVFLSCDARDPKHIRSPWEFSCVVRDSLIVENQISGTKLNRLKHFKDTSTVTDVWTQVKEKLTSIYPEGDSEESILL
jgi:hypothetical protein